ncbi:MAG: response regulator [Phototrophicales bacterium]|nr:response regulator [Phototrophicales bacterium]
MEKLQALVVDDNWYNCDIFRIALEKAGYEVEIAYNGRDGLAFLETKPYKILVIDLQMPGLNGIEVLTEIKDSPIRKKMYILVVTANAYMATEDLEDLSDMVMFKPVNIADLTFFLERVKRIVL